MAHTTGLLFCVAPCGGALPGVGARLRIRYPLPTGGFSRMCVVSGLADGLYGWVLVDPGAPTCIMRGELLHGGDFWVDCVCHHSWVAAVAGDWDGVPPLSHPPATRRAHVAHVPPRVLPLPARATGGIADELPLSLLVSPAVGCIARRRVARVLSRGVPFGLRDFLSFAVHDHSLGRRFMVHV